MKRGNQSQSGYYCEHCDKFLAYSTYKKHRKLFFTATGTVIKNLLQMLNNKVAIHA